MYRKIFTLVLVFSALFASAQIQIGNNESVMDNKSGVLPDDDLDAFKKSTTVFVLQYTDTNRKEDFEKAIASVWKVTPFKVVLPNEAGRYIGKRYSVFAFGASVYSSRNGPRHTFITYELTMPHYKKNGERKGQDIFARFLMSPDIDHMLQISKLDFQKQQSQFLKLCYKDTHFGNWSPGLLKGYLKIINDCLAAEETRKLFEGGAEDEVARLASDTLYVPDYVNTHVDAVFSHKESDDGADEKSERLDEAYPFILKYVSEDVLSDMILKRTKPFYYLVFTRSSAQKFVNVFEGTSGHLVYYAHTMMSYNFKEKDLRKLAKSVKKV